MEVMYSREGLQIMLSSPLDTTVLPTLPDLGAAAFITALFSGRLSHAHDV